MASGLPITIETFDDASYLNDFEALTVQQKRQAMETLLFYLFNPHTIDDTIGEDDTVGDLLWCIEYDYAIPHRASIFACLAFFAQHEYDLANTAIVWGRESLRSTLQKYSDAWCMDADGTYLPVTA